jgi:general secretion pathway protein H
VRSFRSSQGFTLVELIIVLVIAVLGFAAVAISMSSGDQTTQLQAVARDMASALRYAQGEALMTRVPVSVDINLDENTYRISNSEKVFDFSKQIDVSLVVAAEELSEGQGSIRFFADGSSTGGRIMLELGQQLRRIDVNWITGEVGISNAPA